MNPKRTRLLRVSQVTVPDPSWIPCLRGVRVEGNGVIVGSYWDNGKENGNYYLGLRVQGLGFKWPCEPCDFKQTISPKPESGSRFA